MEDWQPLERCLKGFAKTQKDEIRQNIVFILSHAEFDINEQNCDGNTPLVIACTKGKILNSDFVNLCE